MQVNSNHNIYDALGVDAGDSALVLHKRVAEDEVSNELEMHCLTCVLVVISPFRMDFVIQTIPESSCALSHMATVQWVAAVTASPHIVSLQAY